MINLSKEKELIKCGGCNKRFPVNYIKHPNRNTVFCPFCRTEHKQGLIDKEWKPNESYWKLRSIHISKPFTVEDLRRFFTGGLRGRVDLKDDVKRPKDLKEDTDFVKPRKRFQIS